MTAGLRQTDTSYTQFKQLLKTYLFGHWDHGTLWRVTLNSASGYQADGLL